MTDLSPKVRQESAEMTARVHADARSAAEGRLRGWVNAGLDMPLARVIQQAFEAVDTAAEHADLGEVLETVAILCEPGPDPLWNNERVEVVHQVEAALAKPAGIGVAIKQIADLLGVGGRPPAPGQARLTIAELVDSYAEGTLCPAAADTIRAIVAEKRADVPQPPYPADLLDLLATTLAGVWEHLVGEGVEAEVASALDRYEAEVGRENVPAVVAKAIAELSAR